MARKLLIPICLLLALIFATQAFAASAEPTTFTGKTLTFSSYTEGADAAFDGNRDTGYAGSITGMFAERSVVMGVTVRASSPIINLKIKGSENGVDWIQIYEQKKVVTIAMAGYNGTGSVSDSMCDSMYTYSFKYLRFEMEYGSIAEIEMHGYATGVEGYITELDESFGTKGYETSGSYYTDYARMPYVTDHIIHSPAKGEVVTYQFLDAQQSQKLAYITMKAKGNSPITEIALMHKDDKNAARWDGMTVEVSADGQSWVNVMTIPADFSTRNSLRNRTVMIVDVPENDSYVYARIASTRSSISICVMDLYTKGSGASAPANVLLGWEGDPFIAKDAPEETDETADAADETQSGVHSEVKDTDVPEAKGGCGASVGFTALSVVLVCATAVCATRKRRKAK